MNEETAAVYRIKKKEDKKTPERSVWSHKWRQSSKRKRIVKVEMTK